VLPDPPVLLEAEEDEAEEDEDDEADETEEDEEDEAVAVVELPELPVLTEPELLALVVEPLEAAEVEVEAPELPVLTEPETLAVEPLVPDAVVLFDVPVDDWVALVPVVVPLGGVLEPHAESSTASAPQSADSRIVMCFPRYVSRSGLLADGRWPVTACSCIGYSL
jgi:hypothetical protein